MTAEQPQERPLPARSRRDDTIQALSAAFAQDELSMEEFERRIDIAHRTSVPAELDALLSDLRTSASPVPSSRTLALLGQLERLATPGDRDALARAAGPGRSLEEMLIVRRGEPVTQLLEAAEAKAADIVAIGNRRGGPPGPVEGGSIARRFAHLAPEALLAVPL